MADLASSLGDLAVEQAAAEVRAFGVSDSALLRLTYAQCCGAFAAMGSRAASRVRALDTTPFSYLVCIRITHFVFGVK